jgi:magnesium-transporting ATPase (P-type)
VIDFTSERKCMSVLVKNLDGKIINYIKGADESIAGKLL